MEKRKIVDAIADSEGNITGVKLEGNQNFTPLETAIRMAEQGKIDAVVVNTEKGGKYLRTRPDDETQNNLGTLAGKS